MSSSWTSSSLTFPAPGSTSPCPPTALKRKSSPSACRSTAPRCAASRPLTSRTCCWSPTPTRPSWTRSPRSPTLSIIADVEDPITREKYPRDPRNIAKKAEAYLQSTGIADVAYFGPEAEFYVFNDVRYGADRQLRLLRHRLRRGRLELGPRREAQPRLQDAHQGRLLPRAARRTPWPTCAPRWC